MQPMQTTPADAEVAYSYITPIGESPLFHSSSPNHLGPCKIDTLPLAARHLLRIMGVSMPLTRSVSDYLVCPFLITYFLFSCWCRQAISAPVDAESMPPHLFVGLLRCIAADPFDMESQVCSTGFRSSLLLISCAYQTSRRPIHADNFVYQAIAARLPVATAAAVAVVSLQNVNHYPLHPCQISLSFVSTPPRQVLGMYRRRYDS